MWFIGVRGQANARPGVHPTHDTTVRPDRIPSSFPGTGLRWRFLDQFPRAVDIVPILDAAVTKSGQKLDWKRSIVDLMKAVGMDASLDERKELARELSYAGDAHDSARMNTFLHKALMKKLSENGGTVPADLLD